MVYTLAWMYSQFGHMIKEDVKKKIEGELIVDLLIILPVQKKGKKFPLLSEF